MAAKGIEALLAMSLVVALCAVAAVNAQSNCTSVLMRLAPCLDYVTGNSPKPSPPCCTQLGDLVKSQAQCLCEALHGGAAAFGIKLNQTLVESLPSACKVQNPPCMATPPVSSPPVSSPSPVSAPPTDSPSGNAPSDGKSHGNSIKIAYSVLVLALLGTTSLTFI